jgi:hypothetical protein
MLQQQVLETRILVLGLMMLLLLEVSLMDKQLQLMQMVDLK